MHTFLTLTAAAVLLGSTAASAAVVEHRPINRFSDLSIAPADIPTGCKVFHSYGDQEIGGVSCDTQALLEQYFQISPALNPVCEASGTRWECTFKK